jgi:hypothetical protein
MSDKHRRQIERGARVSALCAANPADFPADSVAGASVKRLNEQLAKLEELNVTKAASMSAQQQGSQGRRDLRAELRSQIATIYNTAEVAGRDHPEAKGVFQRLQTDKSDRTLLAVARSYSAAARPLKALFAEYELSADFFDRFDASIDAFEQHMARQSEGAGARVASNAGIEEALRLIDEEVERLDVIARNKYRGDHVKLAAWESASHLERPARRKNGGGNGKTEGSGGNGDGTAPPSHKPQ